MESDFPTFSLIVGAISVVVGMGIGRSLIGYLRSRK
jgi:hypothetical protein